jgi:hypothetical protein
MKFSRRRIEEPEINLIPFIDVLLVVLIFLMLSTTYSRFTELQINLPAADADRLRERPGEIIVAVASDGRYAINRARGRPQHRAADRGAGRRRRRAAGDGGHHLGRCAGRAPVRGQRAGRGAPRRADAPDLCRTGRHGALKRAR